MSSRRARRPQTHPARQDGQYITTTNPRQPPRSHSHSPETDLKATAEHPASTLTAKTEDRSTAPLYNATKQGHGKNGLKAVSNGTSKLPRRRGPSVYARSSSALEKTVSAAFQCQWVSHSKQDGDFVWCTTPDYRLQVATLELLNYFFAPARSCVLGG